MGDEIYHATLEQMAYVRDSAINHIGEIADDCRAAIIRVAAEQTRPCAIMRPTLRQDGNEWCALYGEDLATGVAGFGDTPAEAMQAFDRAWEKSAKAVAA